MRVLITTVSSLGHVNPMVPLASALQARGVEILWATAADTMAIVEQASIPVTEAGLTQAERMPEFWRRNPQAQDLPAEQVPNVMFPKLFGQVAAPPMLQDLLAIVDDWPPDLIVHDAAELAAPIVAARLGIPNVIKTFGPLTPAPRVEAASREVAPLWLAQGLDPRPFAGCYDHLLIDIYPSTLQAPVDHVGARQEMRPVAYDVTPSTHDVAAPERTDRPLVYVTMGTVFNDVAPLQAAVAAVASFDVDVLVTVGPAGDPAALGHQPDHVRVERYIPQTRVLDRCDLVISHAGSGTVLATLASGLPQLCLPQGADQFGNAGAVARAGAGLALNPAEATLDALTAAMGQLLHDDRFRVNAASVAEAIAAMPGPDEVAGVLERLV